MTNIVKIRLHGRGGQGTVTAAELIAVAAFYKGKFSQAFPNFGVERRGAPVMAYARISDKPIRLRQQIYNPDYLIVQDTSLLKTDSSILEGVTENVQVLVNSEKITQDKIKVNKMVSVPATRIALEVIGKPFFNTALVGAFAAMSGLFDIQCLERAITEKFTSKGKEIVSKNVESMKRAYNFVKENK